MKILIPLACLVLSCLMLMLFGLAQTKTGKRQIVRIMTSTLNKDGERRVEMGRIKGLFPFDMTLDRLGLSDEKGQWMTAEGIRLSWSPMALLGGRIRVLEIHADAVCLSRRPGIDSQRGESPEGLPRVPGFLRRLTVEHFAIDRAELGEGLFGEKAIFRLKGGLSASLPEGGRGETSLSLTRLDRTGEHLLIRAALDRDRLTLDMRLTEATGGFLGGLTGLREGYDLSLQGEGPIDNWEGRLRFNSEKLGRLEARLGMHYAEAPGGTLCGDIHLAEESFPKGLTAWIGSRVSFDLALRLQGTKVLTLERARFEARDLGMDMTGSLDPAKESIEGRFSLVVDDFTPLGRPAGLDLAGKGGLEGSFSGPLNKPEFLLEANLDKVKANTFRAGSIFTQLNLGWLDGPDSGLNGLCLQGNGEFRDLALEGRHPLPETRLSWEAAVDWPVTSEIHIRHLKLAGKNLSAEFSGRVDATGPRGALDSRLEIGDLRGFSRFFGLDLPGRAGMEAIIRGDAETRSLFAEVKGGLDFSGKRDFPLAPILGREVAYAGTVRLTETGSLEVEALSLDSLAGSLTGKASLDMSNQALKGGGRLLLPHLAHFTPLLGRSIEGAMEVDISVEGPMKDLALDVEARGRDVVFEDIPLKDLAWRVQAAGLPPSGPTGRFTFAMNPEGRRFQGETAYVLEAGRLRLTSLSLKGPATEVSGKLDVDLERSLLQGDLLGSCTDISELSFLFHEDLEGSVKIQATLADRNGDQRSSLALELADFKSRFGHAADMKIYGEIGGLFNRPQGKVRLHLKGFQREALSLDALTLKVEGDPERFSFDGEATGRSLEPLQLGVTGVYATARTGQTLEFSRFQGHYGDFPLKLSQPLLLDLSPGRFSFHAFVFELGSGTLTGAGKFREDDLHLHLAFDELPLKIFEMAGVPGSDGWLTGRVELLGRPEQPEGNLSFQLNGIRFQTPTLEGFPPVTVKGRAGLKSNELQAEFLFQGLTAEPFEARAELPLRLSLHPLQWSLPPAGRLGGQLLGQVNLARIASLAGLDDQALEGELDVRLDLEGTPEEPVVKGGIGLEKGVYENVRSGTILKDIEIAILAGTPRVTIQKARANDGEKGEISAEGWLDLLPHKGFPFQVDVSMGQASLIRRDDARATVGGRMSLSGSIDEATLTGRIMLETAEFLIPEHLPPEITEIEVLEIDARPGETIAERPPAEEKGVQIELDVTVESPGRIFVRGRGLDSEWEGTLHIQGAAREPEVTGMLSVVRGYFNFLGKRFDLKRGIISFDGSMPPAPRLDLIAEASAKDLTARLQLSGPVESMKIDLSSDPILPSDEILSRLLFGRDVSAITPFQALQLVQAVNVLRGGGLDFMGRTRQLLGIDQLEITQQGEELEGATVKAGKYLSEDVYFKVEQGVASGSGKVSVEWEITPNITVETEAGVNAEGGAGVKWKWDY